MKRSHRRRLAVAIAVGLHGLLAFLIGQRAVVHERPRVRWADDVQDARVAVTIEVRHAPMTTPPTPTAPTTNPPAPTSMPNNVILRNIAAPATAAPTTAAPTTAAPTTAAPMMTPTIDSSAGVVVDRTPRQDNAPGSLLQAVRGSDARGPQPSRRGLQDALDFVPDNDVDAGKSGAVLAAAKAERYLRADVAFHDVTVGMANDWFRQVKGAAERGFRPLPSDLDNPNDVTRNKIVSNFLREPSAWDDEAKRALTPLLQATSLHSQDPVKRLALANSAALAQGADSRLRKSTLDDLLRRKEAGLSVRFAFEVDVHHDATGRVTAVDVLHRQFEKALVEKVRLAIEDAVQQATPAPTLIANGQPFRSRWVLAASWFIDPPVCMLAPSDSMGMDAGGTLPKCGGTFDFGGSKSSSFDVQQTVTAELVRVQRLTPR